MENRNKGLNSGKNSPSISLKNSNKNVQLQRELGKKQKDISNNKQDKKNIKDRAEGKKQRSQIQKYEQQQRTLVNRLLIGTFLDISQLSNKLRSFLQSITAENKIRTITIPEMYYLIKKYERVSNRAYAESLIYYIIALLWDQGIVCVGSSNEWTALAKIQLVQEDKQLQVVDLAQIDGWRQQLVQKYKKKLVGSQINDSVNKADEKSKYKISLELILVIQQIEQQYYRQVLSLKKFSNQVNIYGEKISCYDKVCSLFASLDSEQIGTVTVQKLITKFMIKGFNMSQEEKVFIINRLVNNLHIYDSHSNSVQNPVSTSNSSDPNLIRFNIQNLMQLINRVIQHEASPQNQSETYKSICELLRMYKEYKNQISQKILSQDTSLLRKRNLNIRLIAQMQHIRQAATDIVENGKINGINQSIIREQTQMPIVDLSHYQTIRQNAQIVVDNQPTFRNQINVQIRNKVKEGNVQNILKTAQKYRKQDESLRKQTDIFDKILLSKQKSPSIKSPGKQRKIEQTTKARNQLDNKWSGLNNTAEIKQFQVESQEKERSFYKQLSRSHEKEQIMINIQRYNRLLRERITHQMEIVRLEKIKNRLRYYDILY